MYTIANHTIANHKRYMWSYVAFRLTYQVDDLTQLSAYVEFLLQSGIAPATIPNCLSGIRHYLQAAGMSDASLSSHTLGLTLRSLKIAYDVPPNSKKALTLDQVSKLADYCTDYLVSLKLAILMAFFILCLYNLMLPTAAKFDPAHHSTQANLTLEEPSLQCAQRWAKNRQTQLPKQDVAQVPIPQLSKKMIHWTQCKL